MDVHLDRLGSPKVIRPIEANGGNLDRVGVAKQCLLLKCRRCRVCGNYILLSRESLLTRGIVGG